MPSCVPWVLEIAVPWPLSLDRRKTLA